MNAYRYRVIELRVRYVISV